jgi:hypothetical protein
MKALLVAECRKGKLLSSSYELVAFAEKIGIRYRHQYRQGCPHR